MARPPKLPSIESVLSVMPTVKLMRLEPFRSVPLAEAVVSSPRWFSSDLACTLSRKLLALNAKEEATKSTSQNSKRRERSLRSLSTRVLQIIANIPSTEKPMSTQAKNQVMSSSSSRNSLIRCSREREPICSWRKRSLSLRH